MGDWRFMGNAQRRRSGAPSSHIGGTWSPPTKPSTSVPDDPATAIAGMASTGNPRQPIGREAIASFVNSSAQNRAPLSEPKGHNLSQDPAVMPHATRTPQLNAGENGGARYGIRVWSPPPVSIEASSTQANGRLVRGSGTGGSFWAEAR